MSVISRASAPTSSKVLGTINGIEVHNSCFTGLTKTELNSRDQDYAGERNIALTKNSPDGVKPMTKEEQEAERALNWQLIKKFTMAIFKMDITRFSFPVGYSEPRTFLERSADLFAFLAQGYIDRAIQINDPAKRLAMLGAGCIAGFHLYLQQKKPWNPVIGETYVGKWPNGTTIYGEQTSHHPPVSALQIVPANNSWHCDAICHFEVDPHVTQVNILQHGIFNLYLADGTQYSWEFPTISVTGLISGDRIVKIRGPFEMKDKTNKLELLLNVSPKKDAKKGLIKPQVTTIWGYVRPIPANDAARKAADKSGEVLHKITGDYADKVLIDDEIVWDIRNEIVSRPNVVIPDNDLLLSDCRFRLDRAMLISGDMVVADSAKTLVEVAQRKDSQLRISIDPKKIAKEQKKEQKKLEKEEKKNEKKDKKEKHHHHEDPEKDHFKKVGSDEMLNSAVNPSDVDSEQLKAEFEKAEKKEREALKEE